MASIDEHLRSPEISVDEHVRRTQIALGAAIAAKKAIYLDMRYWILLRSAASGAGSGEIQELLQLLRDGVARGRFFCPISESVFVELMKQSDLSSRKATATLVDELSTGVTLIIPEQRVATELACFLYKYSGVADLHPLKHLVWTKLSYVLGTLHPSQTPFDPAIELAVQKAFFDHLWTIPLETMVATIGDQPLPPDLTGEASEAMNAGITAHADAIRSFQQAYSAEVRGAVDVTCGAIPDILMAIAHAQGIALDQPTPEQRASTLSMFKNLIAAALEKGKARGELPSIHIYASLHASLRWNKGRKLRANDLYDFQHAIAALGYANLFLTEKPLQVMVTERHLALDKLYDCRVVSDVEDAVVAVKAML
ncbi:hypothetical protein [Chelativorans alearense]|uniref:hypothetical protein n=1 Tax=Chelativorans alearense TaxID=2681495 RepID=UPI0013D765D6|nr:hypothetical protein [Chelativorans alearense]